MFLRSSIENEFQFTVVKVNITERNHLQFDEMNSVESAFTMSTGGQGDNF